MLALPIPRILLFILIFNLTIAPIMAKSGPQEKPQSRDFVTVGESLKESGQNSTQMPELWGVVIGVSDYKFGNQSSGDVKINNLRYAARDADSVYDFLISENGGFKKDHVRKLTNQDATKAKVEETLMKFLDQAREQDYVFIFIASHGAYAPNQNGPNQTPYLILYDTDPQRIAETGLGVDLIGQALKQVKAKKGMFISDACHSGGLEFANGRGSGDEGRVRNFLREQVSESKDGIAYLSASNSVEKSYEYPELEHGVFTYYLLEGLRGNARGVKPNIVTVRDLWLYVQNKVAERTENRQHPTLGQNRYDPDLVVSVLPRSVDNGGPNATGATAANSSFGTLSITVRDEDKVEILIDNKPIEGRTLDSEKSVSLPLPAGSHTIQASKGNRVFKKTITINPGRDTALPIRLPLPLAEPAPKVKAKFQEGVKMLEEFKVDAAIAQFNEVATMAPNFPDNYTYLGRAYLKSGKLDQAVAAYDKALELDPDNSHALVLKSEVLLEKGDLGGAEDILKEAVAADPDDGFAPLVLGYAYYLDNKFTDAEDQINISINRDETNPMAYLQLATVLHARNERESAEKATRRSIELFNKFPTEPEKTSGWKSIMMSTKIVKFFDTNSLAEAHLLLGVLILEGSQSNSRGVISVPSEAISNIDKANQYAQNSNNKLLVAQASYYRSEIHRVNNEIDRAIEGYQKALANNSDMAMPYRGLSWCYEKQQKFQAALDNYQKYIQHLNKSDMEKEQEQIDRRLKRLKEEALAHAK